MIRPEVKDALWRWRELIFGIIIISLGANWYITSFGLLKFAGAVTILFGTITIFVGQQCGRFRVNRLAAGIVSLIEGQISYLGPKDGGTVAIADLTGVSLITHEEMRSWRLDQNAQDPLIIPVTAKGGELLFDAFTELKGLNLENMVRQISRHNEHSTVIWRHHDYGRNDQYLH